MSARAHPWMPHSPCGTGCLPRHADRVSLLTYAGRWLVVLVALAGAPALAAGRLLPAAARIALVQRCSRALLRCAGLRLTVTDLRHRGERDTGRETGVLVVAPHVSWTDVLVLTAIAPSGFVARADLLGWGALGTLARRMRVIPIERENLRDLPEVVARIRTRLQLGDRVTVFPEGTTWCGRAHGRFRAALFQAAVDAECPVQPVRLRYLDGTGAVGTAPAFVGDDTIGAAIRRMLRHRGTVADVVLAPLQPPGTDRHDLAARCERAVRGEPSATSATVAVATSVTLAVAG
ncbi:1-acyl-sn-glycerol-3-phosphate acyltransferase [Rhodococcus zopfii]|uniref:1-acyl-sn-glycerol-3-phosphate acyltransferase n=2 Tax=Rhodococcus zopfii TaxID=43772 RepID=A0ABU3WM36_9NOCA|nr:1-acyl-sn-glycerol-3-phosphate acyltransferase [Rhodococcus zopfii]